MWNHIVDKNHIISIIFPNEAGEEADCEVAEKDDSHLAVQVIPQAFLESVGSQRHDEEYNAEQRNGI